MSEQPTVEVEVRDASQGGGGGGGGDDLARLAMSGKWYEVHKTRCAACSRSLLIVSRGRHSALYDLLTIDPLHGPHGRRHECPASGSVRKSARTDRR